MRERLNLPAPRYATAPTGATAISYLDDHLLAGERIVYRAQLHRVLFAGPVAVVVVGAGLAVLLQQVAHDYWYIGAAIAALGVLLALGPALRYVTSEFAVTNTRVLAKVGLVRRRSLETLLGKVEAIEVEQDFAGRLLGYGTITIIGTGGTRETFPMIARPLEFRRQVQTQIVGHEARHPSTARQVGGPAGRVERECPYCAEPILARARVCKHCGRDVAPA